MTKVLVATESVHTTAAACDYLESRVEPSDTVFVLTVLTETVTQRDAGDAANVARTRLFEPATETIQKQAVETGKEGADIADTIHDVGEEYGIDEIVVGTMRGSPEYAGEPPGSTVRKLLGLTSRPVVVVHP